jgi:hypothetical protein
MTMDAAQIAEIKDGLEQALTLLSGDAVTHVTAAGKETSLLTLRYDVAASSKYAEGMKIDNAGLMLDEAQEMSFLTSYLAAQKVTLDVTDHWLINGERWDYVKDAPLLVNQVPIVGIHNIVTVYVRKAVELNASTGSGEFTFGE